MYFLVFRNLLGIIAFLTILPVWRSSQHFEVENISKNMFLFPLVGLVIGFLTIPIVLASIYFFNQYIAAFIITIFLTILTGIHHTDALGDFADGIMAKGSKEKKYKVMHDPTIGSAGAVAIATYMLGMTLAISSISGIDRLLIAIIVSEIVAKYVMVLQAFSSDSAWEGYSSQFTKKMKSKKKIIVATGITIFLVLVISHSYISMGIQMLVLGIICCFIIIYISNRNFGGTSGDVMGATNEIVRLVSLISVS
ncbi:Adenosylcobinamide-GDP ribazoletransferase [Candidatus Nitrosocosmicus franklandus]|uniref:Adenosylcobinamide-GDP ribazoletransferase n=1 Tax=Candidatus Nitrosocosmicus franklandianus TaxID=1798806 RepID=A0A484IAU5_9ARCH|nr:Adenosylcobinamide-GDP ribazoletransferase [Candidatus Nitrosocosmicus franklandus]